ncbi:MAG: S41 family peptidase [Chloroflexaceae bacterium]|nr:S41 family peptidase [Chloroflexaceae bacterium]
MIRITQAFLMGTIAVCLTAMGAFAGGWKLAYEINREQVQSILHPVAAETGQDAPANSSASGKFDIYWQVWNLVYDEFYRTEPLNPQQMVYGSIRGMLQSLGDEYTLFEEPQAAERTRESMRGSFEGIGVLIQLREGELVITRPLKKSPALEAGLQRDDVIVRIGGEEVSALIAGLEPAEALEAVSQKIRGPRGSTVRLTIRRPSDATATTFEVDIVRDVVPLVSVNAQMLTDQVAYIQITEFTNTTPQEFEEALHELLPQNPTNLVLDLRNNAGGVLQAAREVLGFFYEGTALYEEHRGGSIQQMDTIRDADALRVPQGMPLVVLVNEHSASAAEIVAGALDERYPSTTLLGTPTFGKGSVQNVHKLSDGSSVRITIARWLTPNQKEIHGIGIVPDHLVAAAQGTEDTVPCIGDALPPEGQDTCRDAQLAWGMRFLVDEEIPPTPIPVTSDE